MDPYVELSVHDTICRIADTHDYGTDGGRHVDILTMLLVGAYCEIYRRG